MDTICAVSTAPGRAGVAVVRLSGPQSVQIAEALCGSVPMPGRYALRVLRDADGAKLDEALVLRFSAPASFTGEDVVELQTHGSPAVTQEVLAALTGLGARIAEAGEFTRRALENDKLDLVAVEGLGDLLAAETRAQLDQAQSVLSGRLLETVEFLRERLVRAAALLEAMIDFADEEVPEDVTGEAIEIIQAIRQRIAGEIAGSLVADRVRDGFQVAILGAPNVGKSTLLNAIAGRQAALVSEIAGTTRDVIELRTDLRGLPVTWLDTAGLRETDDAVEQMGVRLARDRAEAADLRIFILANEGSEPEFEVKDEDLVLVGKSDIQPGSVSGRTGDGLDAVLNHVHMVLSTRLNSVGSVTRLRHRQAFEMAENALELVLVELGDGLERVEFATEHLRSTVRVLEALVGRIGVEAVLGEIFSSYCIGK